MTPPMDDIVRELEAIAAGVREHQRCAMVYQYEAKCQVAAHYGVTLTQVDLPFPEWAALRERYQTETGTRL